LTGKEWKLVDLLQNKDNKNNKLPPRMLFRTDIYQSEGAAQVVQLASNDSASNKLKTYHRDYLSGRYSGAKLKLIADGRCQLTVLSYHGRNNNRETITTREEQKQQQLSLKVEDRKNAAKALIKLVGKNTCEKSPLDGGHWKASPAIIGGDWNVGFREYIQDGPPSQKGANWTAKIPPVCILPHGVRYYDGAHIDYFVEVHPNADNIASLQMDQPVAVPHKLEYRHFFDHDPIQVGYYVYVTATGPPPLLSNLSFEHAATAAAVDKKVVTVLQPASLGTAFSTFTTAISNLASSRLLSVPSPPSSSPTITTTSPRKDHSIKYKLNAWQQQGEEIVIQLMETGIFEDEDDILAAINDITSTLMDKIDTESNDGISTASGSRRKEEGKGSTNKKNQNVTGTAQFKSNSINVDAVPFTPSPMKIQRQSFISPDSSTTTTTTTTTIRNSNVLTNSDDDDEEEELVEEDNTTLVSSHPLKPSAIQSIDATDDSGSGTTAAARKQCSNPECICKDDPRKGWINYNKIIGGFKFNECHHCRKEKKKDGKKEKEEKEDPPVEPEEQEEGNEKGNWRWYNVWPFYRVS
jgi:hypothetical protein